MPVSTARGLGDLPSNDPATGRGNASGARMGMGMPGGGGQNPGDMFKKFKETAPALSVLLLKFALIGALASFGGWLGEYVKLTPKTFFEEYQIWRYFFSPYLSEGLLTGLFSSLMLYMSANRVERRKGSMYLLHTFLLGCLATNALFLFILGFIVYNPWSPMPDAAEVLGTYGYWPVCFFLMVMEASTAPDENRQFCCCPFQLKTIYHPFLLGTIFVLLTQDLGISFGLLAGAFVVFLCPRISISPQRCRSWESSSLLRWFTRTRNFVACDEQGSAVAGVWSEEASGASGASTAASNTAARGPQPFSMERFGSTQESNAVADSSNVGSNSGRGRRGYAPLATNTAEEEDSASQGTGHQLGSQAAPPRRGMHPLAARMEKELAQHKHQIPKSTDRATAVDTSIEIPEIDTSNMPLAVSFNNQQDTMAELKKLGYTTEDSRHAVSQSDGTVEGALAFLNAGRDFV